MDDLDDQVAFQFPQDVIRRTADGGVQGPTRVRLDAPYSRLSVEEKQRVGSLFAGLAEQDEPPYPEGGLLAIVEPAKLAQNLRGANGTMIAEVVIDKFGIPTEVNVFKTPDAKLADFVARAVMLIQFKPGQCGGRVCVTKFPIHLEFTRVVFRAAEPEQRPTPVFPPNYQIREMPRIERPSRWDR
ncbi:hypothetical protein E4K72_05610 [Oxalobacteraceae bacterium OM1]|nr:hypothetical protein E4K72_05610 [Oxalobacteraceae bacterium OM1]